MTFKRVGVLGHPLRPESGEVCQQVSQSLQARGIDTWQRTHWDPTDPDITALIAESDMVIAIGGGGATLRGARGARRNKMPRRCCDDGHRVVLHEPRPAP